MSYYSINVLAGRLATTTPEDGLALTRIFDEDAASAMTPPKLAAAISGAGGHSIANVLRGGQGVSYCEVLHDVANSVGVPNVEPLDAITTAGVTVNEMDRRMSGGVAVEVAHNWRHRLDGYISRCERAVLDRVLADSYKRLSTEQRSEIDRRVSEIANTLPDRGIANLAGPAAFIAVANAGGFATYMLMSSVISVATLGAASFGAYTAASSILHVVIGPAGWAALGVAAAYRLGAPQPAALR